MNSPKKRVGQPVRKAKAPEDSKVSGDGPNRKTPRFDQIIFRDWCKACGICSAFCPNKVIIQDETGAPVIKRPDACIGCRFCELHCPDFAITIKKRKPTETRSAS